MRIIKVRTATMEEWQRNISGCVYATFFHTPEWYQAFCSTYRQWTIESRYVQFSDGAEAIMPLVKRRVGKGLLKSYMSSPEWTYGGWVAERPLGRSHCLLLLKELASLQSIVWRENPYDPDLHGCQLSGAKEDFTHVLDLRGGYSEILRGWTKGSGSTARKARKAQREGVEVKLGTSLADWESYYRIYEDSLRRWGSRATRCYPFDLFANLARLSTDKVKLWLAEYNGAYISGAVCFYTNHHVAYWNAASLEKFFVLRPANLLMSEIIKDACAHGYWWYDFNPSGGHEGVANFKKSFGAEPRRTRVLRHATRWFRTLTTARRMVRYLTPSLQ